MIGSEIEGDVFGSGITGEVFGSGITGEVFGSEMAGDVFGNDVAGVGTTGDVIAGAECASGREACPATAMSLPFAAPFECSGVLALRATASEEAGSRADFAAADGGIAAVGGGEPSALGRGLTGRGSVAGCG